MTHTNQGHENYSHNEAFELITSTDNLLIKNAILNGYVGDEYIQQIMVEGKLIKHLTVIGCQALALFYGAIKAKVISTIDKTGELIIARNYGSYLDVNAKCFKELSKQDDYYEIVMKVRNVITGQSTLVRVKESKVETNIVGDPYERHHYDVIAEFKAFSMGVLRVIPENVIKEFKCDAILNDHVVNGFIAEQNWNDNNAEANEPTFPTTGVVVKQDANQNGSKNSWPAKDGDNWVDSSGDIFDPKAHAWSNKDKSPSVRKDGTFRAKRVVNESSNGTQQGDSQEAKPSVINDGDDSNEFNME